MPVPSLITDLSTTAGSNSPAGSENVFPDLDNHLRAISAFIASIRDNSGNGWVSPYLPLAGGTVTGATTFSNTVALGGTPTAPTATSGTNTTQVATTAFVQTALRTLYPVGSVYINATNNTNPGTLLGFGTWVAFGAGRVPVGFDAGNALFDTAEETGGSADAIAVAHTHTFSATTGTESAGHTHSGTTDSAGAHTHTATFATSAGGNQYFFEGRIPGSTGTISDGINSAGAHTHTFSTGGVSANHTHSVSGTTASTGASGTNANLQPYITVYMWKRTA